MSNSIKKLQSQVMTNVAEPRNVEAMKNQVGSTYEAIAIIAKRSTQIASQIREELHAKLEEFASSSDNLEEIHENREQIEISKHYEKLAHPTLMATEEFLEKKVYYRNPSKEAPKPLF
ncbi:hypothetical protein LBMAG27_05100 [Bacteroidota bacterium]|nr:hypothetical protein LBMAG27_05100 [Bacteroidota bacterium]